MNWEFRFVLFILVALLSWLALPIVAHAQVDPGPRTWPGGEVPFIPNIDPIWAQRAADGRTAFGAEWTVVKGNAISPFFGLQINDGTSCKTCHANPATGGDSPASNLQIAAASAHGATNTVPSFVTSTGPSVTPIVVTNQTIGSTLYQAGQVLTMFVPNGRTDAGACSLTQPPFATLGSNVVVHQASPFWRDGLIEATSLASFTSQQAANAGGRTATGQVGQGITLGRFGGVVGFKGDLKSVRQRTDFALLVELGVTSPTWPRKTFEPNGGTISADCAPNPLPEDGPIDTVWGPPQLQFGLHSWHLSIGDLMHAFVKAVDAPPQICAPSSGSSTTCYTSAAAGMPNGGVVTAGMVFTGQQQFVTVGCDICHTPTQTAGASNIGTIIAGKVYGLGSDKAFHHMGTGLADGLTPNGVSADDYVTTKLIGKQYTVDFLHDGRTKDLQAAILAHSSTGSEANNVITQYQALSTTLQQDILDYLRNGPFQ